MNTPLESALALLEDFPDWESGQRWLNALKAMHANAKGDEQPGITAARILAEELRFSVACISAIEDAYNSGEDAHGKCMTMGRLANDYLETIPKELIP